MNNKLLVIILLLFCRVLYGQKNINNYDMTCFCSARETPEGILSYDNNLQIILSLKDGLSKKELDSLQIPYTDSQLKLLRVYNLIRKENNKYYLTFPLLDKDQTLLLRNQSKQIADSITPLIENDAKDMVSFLASTGRSQNAFSIIFSYVLDGLVWNEFEENGEIKPIDSNDDITPWTGFFWVLEPRREPKYGTNSLTDSILSISFTNGAPYRLMNSLFIEEDLLRILLDNIRLSGKVTDRRVIEVFGKYNMFDNQGNVTIPIIRENNQSRLFLLSEKISDKICKGVLNDISLDKTMHNYGFKSKEQTLIIVYHEIMWDLLSNLLDKNILTKPLVLENPKDAEMKDVSDLMFITEKE